MTMTQFHQWKDYKVEMWELSKQMEIEKQKVKKKKKMAKFGKGKKPNKLFWSNLEDFSWGEGG